MVFDWDDTIKRNQKLPNSFRCLLIGASNSGKTCLLLKFLLTDKWLDYNNLIFVGNSLFQTKYKIIDEAFSCGLSKEQVRGIFDMKREIIGSGIDVFSFIKHCARITKSKHNISVTFLDSEEDIPDPRDIDKNLKTVVIFDDTVNNRNQDIQKAYFTRGRHTNCSVFYLSQSYFELDRRSIRKNANLLILFELDERDVQNLWYDKVSRDMSLDEFRKFCKDSWNEEYGFVYIDLTKTRRTYKTKHQLAL